MKPLPRASAWVRSASWLSFSALVASLLVAGSSVVPASAAPSDAQPRGTSVFQIASFNLLGAGHTDKKNGRKGFANSPKRLDITRRVIESRGVDVIGFQEMHYSQAEKWTRDTRDTWGTFPGKARGADPARNSISWRKSVFTPIARRTVKIPYFFGNELPMPYVQLEHRATGQRAWFINVHNPANSGGDQSRWRTKAMEREAALVRRLKREFPALPVFLTGDMNDREKFFCPMVRMAPLVASAGGYRSTDGCRPPARMDVDWIMSTPDNKFTSHTSLRDERVRKASDHPFIVANANVHSPRVKSSPIDRVVVIAAGGLGGHLLQTAPAGATPSIRRLMRQGASTTSARTTPETTLQLPNLTTILTGRRVARANGGHGVTTNGDPGRTVHASAGQYTSSLFDLAHNHGMKTALYSGQPRSAVLKRTWDGANGGGDPYGRDNGRDKIDVKPALSGDRAVASRVASDLRSSPARISIVELTSMAGANARYRYQSAKHLAALRDLDRRVGSIVGAVNRSPALAKGTMVVLAGTSGAKGTGSATEQQRRLRQVPLVVRGPGVARDVGLYSLNPASKFDARSQGRYDGRGPIMVGAVANLATSVLRLPPIPGSQVNTSQSFNVFPRG